MQSEQTKVCKQSRIRSYNASLDSIEREIRYVTSRHDGTSLLRINFTLKMKPNFSIVDSRDEPIYLVIGLIAGIPL